MMRYRRSAHTDIVLYAVAGGKLLKLAAGVHEGFAVPHIRDRQKASKQNCHGEGRPCSSSWLSLRILTNKTAHAVHERL